MSRTAFREAARDQRVCAATGVGGRDFHAHHAVRVQDVRRHGGNPDDPRNALRLQWQVHLNSHGIHPIELRCLTDENIEYAFELLGETAADYLHRHYTGDDPRVDEPQSEA